MQEALEYRKVIDPLTGASPSYFDLSIEEGHLLSILQEFFDLTVSCHAGCSVDERSPSIRFRVANEKDDSHYVLSYQKEILFSTFREAEYFRKTNVRGCSVRDLEALVKVYNNPLLCQESLAFSKTWNDGVVGNTRTVELTFQNHQLKQRNGFHYLLEEGDLSSEAKGTVLEKMEKSPLLHYTVGRLMWGILQMAAKSLPLKLDIEEHKGKILQLNQYYRVADG